MNGWFNPENWLDIFSQVILVIGVLAAAAAPALITARSRRDIRDVKEQVTNGHTSPMRLDLDRVLLRLDEISEGLSNLRKELLHEESRRRDSVQDLHVDLERTRNDCFENITRARDEFNRRLSDVERRMSHDG